MLVLDQPDVLEHLQVLGDSGPADRQARSQFADGTRALDQSLKQRPPSGIGQGAQNCASVSCHER
jgi:hypothetical protein